MSYEQTIPVPSQETSFYQQIAESRVGRSVTSVMCAVGILSAGETVVAPAVDAASIHHVYRTDGDGLWLHAEGQPGVHSQLKTLMPDGTPFDVSCWQYGDNVNGNPVWLSGKDIATGQSGTASDYYIDTRWKTTADLTDQGIPKCGEADPSPQTKGLQAPTSIPTFVSFDRQASAQWALEHAEDRPPNAGSCTWFVSQALIKGGFTETTEWNDDLHGATRDGLRYGTDDAWLTNDFLQYMKKQPFAKVESLGQLKSGINNVPDARPGDVMLYDWDNDGAQDHADLVTGTSSTNPQYPLVSGWSEDGSKALKYNQRGWTWSEKKQMFLQQEPDNREMTATLIHFTTEDEVPIS